MQLQNRNKNPYYGMTNTLRLYNQGGKGNKNLPITAAFTEADTANKLGLLMSIITQIGDVPGRTPLGLPDLVENGGYAERDLFRDTVIPEVLRNLRRKTDRKNFARLVVKYVTADNLFATRVQTSKRVKGKSHVIKVINMIEVWGVDIVADIAVEMIKNPMFAFFVAKWMIGPKFAKNMRDETRKINESRFALLMEVSKKMDWPVKTIIREDGGKFTDFIGYREWKKGFTGTWESYVFSSGVIKTMDTEQLFQFFQGLPADARGRVKMRLRGEKWDDLRILFNKWEKSKEEAQKEVRVAEQELKNAKALGDENAQEHFETKLKEAKKKAKVTSGAVSSRQLFDRMISKGQYDSLQAEAFVSRIKNKVPMQIIVDVSASMNGLPVTFAAFLAAIAMRTSPDTVSQNIIGLFGSHAQWFGSIDQIALPNRNAFMHKEIRKVNAPLYDSEESLEVNFNRLRDFITAHARQGSTDVSSLAKSLRTLDEQELETLRNRPVWLIHSDGQFNNARTPVNSMLELLEACDHILGFRPYILILEISQYGSLHKSTDIRTWRGLDNVMVVPPSPENLEIVLSNFEDMNVFDSYAPLQSIAVSKRYEWVRNTFNKTL